MITCQARECDSPAEIGAIYRHKCGSMVAHPIYYTCNEHLYTDKLVSAWLANQ